MFKRLRLMVLIMAVICAPAIAQMTKPGPSLNMLQQIQGTWRSGCLPVATGSRYQEIKLAVSFTHFTFTTDEFLEPDCRMKHSGFKARYRFILRDPLITRSNTEVFAIDFLPDDVPSERPALYPLNIIKYEGGTLRLGSPPQVAAEERLQRLDRDLIFSR